MFLFSESSQRVLFAGIVVMSVGLEIQAQPSTVNLRVATFNVGMLEVGSPVPLIGERLSALGAEVKRTLDEQNIDILSIQEAWTKESLETLETAHPDYQLIAEVRNPSWPKLIMYHDTGLAYLIKKSIPVDSAQFLPFSSRPSYVCGFGLICQRGVLSLGLRLGDQRVRVLNTHLTPIYDLIEYRAAQLEEIQKIRFVEAYMENEAVILAADLNAGPSFGDLRDGDDGDIFYWQGNSNIFLSFMHASPRCIDTVDSFLGTEFANGLYTQDRDRNFLTAQSQSTRVEPSQRLDHVIVCDSARTRTVVNSVSLLFEEPLALDNGTKTHLSDHFGLVVEIEITHDPSSGGSSAWPPKVDPTKL